MSTSGRVQEKKRKSSGSSSHNHDEESAARTRPLSFDEIMLRRTNKKLCDKVIVEVEDVGNIRRNSVVENVPDPSESERDSSQQKDLPPAVEKPISQETLKASSRKKETGFGSSTKKEEHFGNEKVRGGHELVSLKDERHRETRLDAKGSETGSRQRKYLPSAVEKPISKETVKSSSRKKDTCRLNSNKTEGDFAKEKVRGGHESESFKNERHRDERTAKGGDPLEFERGSRQHKYFPPLVEKPTSAEPLKASSRKKETYNFKSTKKEDDMAKEKGREGYGSKSLKEEQHTNRKTEAKGGKTEKRLLGRRKIDERSSDRFLSESVKKHSGELEGKERHVDQSRGNSERESKRKYQNGNDDKIRDRNAAKKHDLGKHHVLEIAEREERKESSKSRFGESRLKRGRSRSRDREDRHTFSSRSPRAQKYTAHKLEIRSEISSRSLKDRSERQNSDIEKSRVASNGSSSHYRGHGVPENRLGGYSPRKRRTESALKTPSPPDRSPEKKNARWDHPPMTDKVLSGSVASLINSANSTNSTNAHEMAIAVAVASDSRKSISGISPVSFFPKKNASIDSVQLTQATRPTRRLYVENVPCSASEDTLVESLNSYLLSSGVNHIQGTRPCISCVINREKGQAVAEFLTPEDALAALSFDGSDLSGSILKIRRPSDFVEVATGDREKSVAVIESISDVVKDSPNKIFIGGFSKAISSTMLMEIINVFGPMKAYHFEVNKELDEPCAFVEYVDQSVTLKACAGLNGMKLGGRVLTAVQAIRDASSLENTGNASLYKIPEYAKPLLKQPSQVLKLRNVFTVENISSSSEPQMQELLDDVRLECARFGSVKSIKLVKHHIVTTGASEAVNHVESGGWQHLESKGGAKPNTSEEHVGNESREISRAKFPSATEVKEDQVAEGNPCKSDKPADELSEVDSCRMGHLDENIAIQGSENLSSSACEELRNQLNNMQDVSECYDKKTTEAIKTMELSLENKPIAEEGSTLEEADGEKQETFAGKDGSVGAEPDANPKRQVKEQDHREGHDYDPRIIFEPGCVLVEFGRTEASLIAAHCLHGRTFEDRIVTVEYIALDLYRAQFPH